MDKYIVIGLLLFFPVGIALSVFFDYLKRCPACKAFGYGNYDGEIQTDCRCMKCDYNNYDED